MSLTSTSQLVSELITAITILAVRANAGAKLELMAGLPAARI